MTLWIDPGAGQVLEVLRRAGHKAYLVGGCVRDSLAGRTPQDWDICTSARPRQTMELFGPERCIPTGLQHGTVTVSPKNPQKGDKVTIATTPEDGYTVDTVTVIDTNGKIVEATPNDDGTYTYTPSHNKVGKDSFTFTVTDPGGNTSDPAKISIEILKPTDKATYADMEGVSAYRSALRLAEEADVKRLLSVYYRQELLTEAPEDVDGERAVTAHG